MAGGLGSRFWPMSTSRKPKQFQDILGTGRTMIQQTWDRLLPILPKENILVVTHRDYEDITREQLPDLLESNLVSEPVMKNTAACILYASEKIRFRCPHASILVCPSDHLILNQDSFNEKIHLAFAEAQAQDCLITLGITPSRPDTGYGYIQFHPAEENAIQRVKTFTEKPNLELAESFVKSGDFLWNAGIFVWSVDSIHKAFENYLPDMLNNIEDCPYDTPEEKTFIEQVYPLFEKISIDNGILERANNVFVIPADLGWSDLGTWTSIYEKSEKDSYNNTLAGRNVVSIRSKGNVIRLPRDKSLIVEGLENYIIVDTPRGLLICPRSSDQDIKKHLLDLKSTRGGDTFL